MPLTEVGELLSEGFWFGEELVIAQARASIASSPKRSGFIFGANASAVTHDVPRYRELFVGLYGPKTSALPNRFWFYRMIHPPRGWKRQPLWACRWHQSIIGPSVRIGRRSKPNLRRICEKPHLMSSALPGSCGC